MPLEILALQQQQEGWASVPLKKVSEWLKSGKNETGASKDNRLKKGIRIKQS